MSSKARGFGRVANKPPQDPTQVPPGIDGTTYFAPSIPDEVRICVPVLHITPTELLRETLQALLKYLKGGEILDEEYALMQKTASKVEGLDFSVLFTGLYSIIRIAIRQKAKNASIHADMLKMNVPGSVVEDIARVIRVSRGDLERAALANRIRFPRLEKLRWRVDVVISSGSLSRVLRPTILMQMILSNKVIKTFEVSIEQFSQLRYGVAKVLNDMQTLERHPIMRIVKEFERRDVEERNK